MINRILIILAIILATVLYSKYQSYSLESQLVQDGATESVLARMPLAHFETLKGADFALSDQKAELFIVHFWGTWCAPCEAELPDLLKFIKHYEAKSGVKFLLVAVNDDLVKVKKHLKELGETAPNITWLMDNKNTHRDLFGTTRVPETFVFSSDKTTLRKYMGPQEWNKPLFLQTFDEFLQISSRQL